MTTTGESSEENDRRRDLEGEISELRTAKKELFERARPIDEELEKVAKRERECVDELHRLTAENHDRENQHKIIQRLVEVESDNKQLKHENETLKNENSKIADLNSKLKQSLNEAAKSLSDVQERLTVAQQVTAATQQRALQESDMSQELQLELTPQHQPTTRTGFLSSDSWSF